MIHASIVISVPALTLLRIALSVWEWIGASHLYSNLVFAPLSLPGMKGLWVHLGHAVGSRGALKLTPSVLGASLRFSFG